MHETSKKLMSSFVNNYLLNTDKKYNVLDVGSYDVNGNFRYLFDNNRFR